jgi:hypothetical protein
VTAATQKADGGKIADLIPLEIEHSQAVHAHEVGEVRECIERQVEFLDVVRNGKYTAERC